MEADSRAGIILDSSVWIALLHKEDSQHAKAEAIFDEITAQVFVPEYVLVEVASILRNYKRNREAQEFVKKVLEDSATFIPSGALAYETANMFRARNDKLSFVDTSLLVLSRRYRVITFDKVLARALRAK